MERSFNRLLLNIEKSSNERANRYRDMLRDHLGYDIKQLMTPGFVAPPKPARPAPPQLKPSLSRDFQSRYWRSNESVFASRIREEVNNGLDPNITWAEDEMVPPRPTGGCVIPSGTDEWHAWFHVNTPLHQALKFRDAQLARFLLDRGANVNIYNAFGLTPLHEAILSSRKPEDVLFLLQNGADVEAPTLEAHVQWDNTRTATNIKGMLPVHIAMSNGNAPLLRLLVHHGAGLDWSSPQGWNLLDLALLAEDRQVTTLLLSHGLSFSAEPRAKELLQATDQAGLARGLLEITSSSHMIPPQEFYQVYRQCVRQMDAESWSSTDANEALLQVAERLIDKLFAELYCLAQLERKSIAKNLCPRCCQFQSQLQYYFENRTGMGGMDFRLHENKKQLETSSSHCPLCCFVAEALGHAVPDETLQTEPPKGQPSTASKPQPADVPHSPARKGTKESDSEDESVRVRVNCFAFGLPLMSNFAVTCGRVSKRVEVVGLDETSFSNQGAVTDAKLGTGSMGSMATARKWYEVCKTSSSHAECQHFARHPDRLAKQAYPTRLLDVRDSSRDPFLLTTGPTFSPEYLALSYCWGPATNTLRTTRGNIEAHKKGIPFEDFPACLQDAVVTTRKLGFRYLWIDALCIIQDDPGDWAAEASKMDLVYRGAEITISSLTAEKSSDKLFQPRLGEAVNPVPLKIWLNKRARFPWRPGVVHQKAILRDWLVKGVNCEGPIHSRGWTLQEQLLSSRILYFGSGMLHWECLCAFYVEPDPTRQGCNISGYQAVRQRTEPKTILKEIPSSTSAPTGTPNPLEIWQKQLESYTRRHLTKSSDRLPAFWAVSKFIEAGLQSTFVGGVWWGDELLESLCWALKTPDQGHKMSPSWTWVSTQGELSFELLSRQGRHQEVVPLAALISTDAAVDPVSFNVSGTITLKGSLYPAKLFEKLQRHSLFLTSLFDSANHLSLSDYYAFDLLAFPHGPQHKGFGMPMYPNGRDAAKVVLLLEQVDSTLNKFQRVGIVEVGLRDAQVEGLWIDDERKFEDVVILS